MGTYSKKIPRNLAKKLVKTHPGKFAFQFLSDGYKFWFRQGDKQLHYGINSMEGNLPLNKKGIKFYDNYKDWQ